jgi:hypothetical protein
MTACEWLRSDDVTIGSWRSTGDGSTVIEVSSGIRAAIVLDVEGSFRSEGAVEYATVENMVAISQSFLASDDARDVAESLTEEISDIRAFAADLFSQGARS